MKYFNIEALQKLPSRHRAHLINTCTGYKSANLIGSKDKNGISNLAVFNSVVHIGSNPPMLGFILRPLTVRRDTYHNFKETGFFTVNQITSSIIKAAHHTSASYNPDISEFSKTGLTEMYLDDFFAPYVAQSNIKIGCSYINEYTIKENGCLLIIGAIEHLYLPENIIQDDGWLHLEKADTAAIIGLDGYALPKLLNRFNYQQPDELIKTIL
ncbi:NADH-FMN oxidoreductase RutF, flavin reductase (DIM6/NTAB) family [Maribacter sedimenticola]|uniref:NADH-FMN oxidoreductase RutF, flavin reductase (DIM6/NTAB) family n=1 Tax=Maribacter sedimenticola TaxID=228956 RepID=A0ABY1SM15_9FLAO|nr:flavin reductase [Maribacter sedimenticola]SNR79159.1 NADH-FMN oxidoreductase RutF, flavin reductase (DIM6/NTAB) family [Maribacter sedimenticola]